MTNDVDLGAEAHLVNATRTAELLIGAGYERDSGGYPFRYARMTKAGLQIIDLLVDSEERQTDGALSVYGLHAAAAARVDVDIEISRIGIAAIQVPSLDGAFLLRALALEGGPSSLKFVDYARDAASLAILLEASPEDLVRWRTRSDETVARARELTLPLFESDRAPGSLASARDSRGDPAIAARHASSAIRGLLG